jgi:hypothetical protein
VLSVETLNPAGITEMTRVNPKSTANLQQKVKAKIAWNWKFKSNLLWHV